MGTALQQNGVSWAKKVIGKVKSWRNYEKDEIWKEQLGIHSSYSKYKPDYSAAQDTSTIKKYTFSRITCT